MSLEFMAVFTTETNPAWIFMFCYFSVRSWCEFIAIQVVPVIHLRASSVISHHFLCYAIKSNQVLFSPYEFTSSQSSILFIWIISCLIWFPVTILYSLPMCDLSSVCFSSSTTLQRLNERTNIFWCRHKVIKMFRDENQSACCARCSLFGLWLMAIGRKRWDMFLSPFDQSIKIDPQEKPMTMGEEKENICRRWTVKVNLPFIWFDFVPLFRLKSWLWWVLSMIEGDRNKLSSTCWNQVRHHKGNNSFKQSLQS